MATHDHSEASQPERAPRREAAGAWAVSLALIALAGLAARAVPLVQANLVAIVAAVFFFVPRGFLPGGARAIDDYGWSLDRVRPALRSGAWLSAITALFLPAFHLWLTVAQPALAGATGHTAHAWQADFDLGAYRRLPDRWFGEPRDVSPEHVHVFHNGERIFVEWTPEGGPWKLRVHTDGELLVHRRLDSVERSAWTLEGADTRRIAMSFATRGARHIHVEAQHLGEPVAQSHFRLGPRAETPEPAVYNPGALTLPLRHTWLLNLLLTQLLLIAFAEEFFYRGYLQKRWSEGRKTRVALRLGPLRITRTNVVVSALFALGHLAIEPGLARLAVFFPSLLFGALRDRDDSIAGATLYHATCNVIVQLAAVHYY